MKCHGQKEAPAHETAAVRKEAPAHETAAVWKEAPAPEAIKLKKEASVHKAVTVGKEAPAKKKDAIVTKSTVRTFSGMQDGTVRGGMQEEEVARGGRGGTRSRGHFFIILVA